jgi:hypothetical protein
MITLLDRGPASAAMRATALAEQALFAEARRRRQRRWKVGGGVAILISAVVVAAVLTWPPGLGAHGAGRAGAGWPAASARGASMVWVDSQAQLHVGELSDVGRVREHIAAEANAAPLALVSSGHRVYWVDPAGTYVPALGYWSQVIRYLDLRTGRTGLAGAGQTVFAAPGGRDLFTSQGPAVLGEFPAGGGRERAFTLPAGWYLPGGDGTADALSGAGLATTNGVLVQSRLSPGIGSSTLALWQPGSRTVKVIGRGRGALAAYTPPGGSYSLLAWLPAACQPPGSCLIRILNTASGATWTIRSPSPGGFAYGGAFSPDGTMLAAFVTSPSRRTARLALIDVATGTVRLAGRSMPLGEDFGWATWLPGGRSLLADGYLVSAATLASRPLRLAGPDPGNGPDFTTVIVPRRS